MTEPSPKQSAAFKNKPRLKDFDKAFQTAMRKNNVMHAAYLVFDNSKGDGTTHVMSGGEQTAHEVLQAMMNKGLEVFGTEINAKDKDGVIVVPGRQIITGL